MALVIAVMGDSGAGKTTSLQNLNPETTYIIDADKKGLSWRGWRAQYNAERKNYYKCDNAADIQYILQGINEKRPDIKVVVVDTINGIMVADEMRRSREKGYDKWLDLATAVYYLVDNALYFRDDLTVVFIAHTQTDREEDGYRMTRIKTSGKKIDKIVLESKFPVVLLAKVVDGKHVFETRANNSTAKTPMGAFETDTIPNDLAEVIKILEDFR